MTNHSFPGRRLRAGLTALAFAGFALLLSTPALAVDESDLLPVDEAFALKADAPSPDRIAISWKIAKGYYLYRHRISVKADAGFAAQPLQLPKGKAHKDQFFGDVETYHSDLNAVLPGKGRGASTTLTIKYQGCAEAGVCYPPQTRTLTVALPGAAAIAATAANAAAADPVPAAAPLANFGSRVGASNPLLGAASPLSAPGNANVGATEALPLPPEQAFGFEAIAQDGNTLLLRFTPARGYYLYRDKTSLKTDNAAIAAGKPQWPRGTAHRDEHFGDVTVFFEQIDVPLPLIRRSADAATIVLTAGFQGCQTDGICYPPMTRKISVDLPAGTLTAAAPAEAAKTGASTATLAAAIAATDAASGDDASTAAGANATGAASDPVASGPANVIDQTGANANSKLAAATAAAEAKSSPATGAAAPQAEDSLLAATLAGPNRYLALLSFFGFGLLLAFTPCVLPMVPILSGLIVGQGPGLGAKRAFALSLVYVLASAVVFTIAGVIAGLVGANLQIAFQTPWVIVLFALLFLVLSLSSFGLYELQLPHRLRNLVGEVSNRQRSGSWAGVAIMGALSALIVGPCVAPPLAAAVLYIGQTRDPVFGGAALFALAMGMGAPLIAFGVAAGKGLPTSGPWMVGVQRAFGLVFVGMAIWMLGRILPGPVTLALWGALLLGAAVMIALPLSRGAFGAGVRGLGWIAALLLGLTGAVQIVGALAGSTDPLRPLAGLRGGAAAHPAELPFRKIKSSEDLDREIAAAQSAGRPLMLDFYADWCVACKEMEKYTFPEPQVHQALDGFVLLKADVTANDDLDQALMKRLGIIGPPMTLYFVHGAERRDLRLVGFEKAPEFAQRAARAREAAR
ncbi:protein-disulfide reductase DsbD [Lysobacter gummosus]|uniref:protein-disulfide reductase DsbD n=1 Tax=Lysobacter gummosus TaxID=262324 RepID=UPI0036400FAA